MSINKKKVATSATAIGLAGLLLLGGSFAWQSISQTALNEASDVINPGGRLHDDFNGENKDVYVENFANENIYARIRLDEYFKIIQNKGTPAEKVDEIAGKMDTDTGEITSWATHYFDSANATDEYWEWLTGGSTIYMPTFNKNKDSLLADINGTYNGNDGIVTDEADDDRYEDYVEYADGEAITDDAEYDADSNDIDDDNVEIVSEEHIATSTLDATLMSMQEWIDAGSQPGEYWVYDTDGWVYWAQAIEPDTATGLLLDGIGLTQVMDDSWYYGINVVAQFITADDLGKADNSGFYADGETVSDDALTLLESIGVDISGESSGDDDYDDEKSMTVTMTIDDYSETVDADYGFFEYRNHSLKNRAYQVSGVVDGVNDAELTYSFDDSWDYSVEDGTEENYGWTIAVANQENDVFPEGTQLAKINNTTGEFVILCEEPLPECLEFAVTANAVSGENLYEGYFTMCLYSTDFVFEIIPSDTWYLPDEYPRLEVLPFASYKFISYGKLDKRTTKLATESDRQRRRCFTASLYFI